MERGAHGQHGEQRRQGEGPVAQLHKADIGVVGDEL